MSSTASTDLVPLEQVEHALLHGGEFAPVDPEQVQADIVARILASETLQDAFAGFDATPAETIDGANVTVHGVAWMRSSFNEGPPVYMLLKVVVRDTGEQLTVSCGGRSVMAGFLWAQRHEAMPMDGVFRKERSSANPDKSYWTFKLAQ